MESSTNIIMSYAPPPKKPWADEVEKKQIKFFQWHSNMNNGTRKKDSVINDFERITGMRGVAGLLLNLGFKKRSKGFTIVVRDNVVGVSVCSKKDQFSYERGRRIAYSRLNMRGVQFNDEFSEWVPRTRNDG